MCHNFFQHQIRTNIGFQKLSECIKQQNKMIFFLNKPVGSASLQSIVFLKKNFAPEAYQPTLTLFRLHVNLS